ncbi:MAG: hypothetical protein UX96_C0001G0001, partial [Candidatus Wolfebacteria bacterium GW2011_GWB1_47_243]
QPRKITQNQPLLGLILRYHGASHSMGCPVIFYEGHVTNFFANLFYVAYTYKNVLDLYFRK